MWDLNFILNSFLTTKPSEHLNICKSSQSTKPDVVRNMIVLLSSVPIRIRIYSKREVLDVKIVAMVMYNCPYVQLTEHDAVEACG
jgi:hypothetical protein